MKDERSMVVLGAVVGAALGGLAGYLFLTERGRRFREDLEPRLGAFAGELAGLRGVVAHARAAVEDGLRAAGGVAEDGEPDANGDRSSRFDSRRVRQT